VFCQNLSLFQTDYYLNQDSISVDAPPPPPPFEINAMKASAVVYVVYTLK
jgi:hypothetical protein